MRHDNENKKAHSGMFSMNIKGKNLNYMSQSNFQQLQGMIVSVSLHLKNNTIGHGARLEMYEQHA